MLIKVEEGEWRKLSAAKSIYHQHGDGGKYNRKFVSKNGKHEAVYDKNGNLVTDDENQGTYNYASPDDWFGHFLYDILPYWFWGNTPSDPTPFRNRVGGPDKAKKRKAPVFMLSPFLAPIQGSDPNYDIN